MLLVGVAIGSVCYGQTTSPEVIASSGDHFTGTNAQLSWTIGEVASDSYSNGTNQLTQGFHQTNLTVTGIDVLNSDYAINIFPNPTTEQISIKVADNNEKLNIEIFDINGKSIIRKTLNNQTSINVQEYANGTYFLKISNEKNQLINSSKILKQ